VILAASRELEQKVALRTAELSARNEELLALNALAGSLTRSLDPEAIVGGALDAVRAVLPISAGRGFLVNHEAQLTARGPSVPEHGALLEETALAAYTSNQSSARTRPAPSSGCRSARAVAPWAPWACAAPRHPAWRCRHS
jgi:GAF domain-containing protein